MINLEIEQFQSTLPQGERPYKDLMANIMLGFQSTLPQGERHCQSQDFQSQSTISIHAPTRGATKCNTKHIMHMDNFNPRSHKGSDGTMLLLRVQMIISIHAPTRGATLAECAEFEEKRISIHAPTRGATIYLTDATSGRTISIHAPTRGATYRGCRKVPN